MIYRTLEDLKKLAKSATQDPDLWCSIGALDPLIDKNDREFIATFHPKLILELLNKLEADNE